MLAHTDQRRDGVGGIGDRKIGIGDGTIGIGDGKISVGVRKMGIGVKKIGIDDEKENGCTHKKEAPKRSGARRGRC